MTTKEFERELAVFMLKCKQFAKEAKGIAGVIAVELFKDNFQTESFFGRKWKEVQRRIPGTRAYKYPKRKRARRTRKILTDTGDLGRSIKKTNR
jgi:hypothetical protein